MKPLYMIEMSLDPIALHKFLHLQGFARRPEDIDFGYGIHAWLGAAFGLLAPKPWRLFMDRRRPPRLLGYASHDADELREYMAAFADPVAARVCGVSGDIASKAMPFIGAGRSLGFEVLCCPVGRKTGSGIEKDIFLIAADNTETDELDRSSVYCKWILERLEQRGVSVSSVELSGFKHVRQMRQTNRVDGRRRVRYLIRPHAEFRGILTVTDPEGFRELLMTGVGRHRAFGYGMILLRPVM